MICVVRSVTFGGHTVYRGQVQVDVHQDVPVFEGALCLAGFGKDDVNDALVHARDGLRRLRLASRIPMFSRCTSPVAVLRGSPPGRVVYLPHVYVTEIDDVMVFEQVALGTFPEDIDVAIRLAREHAHG